MTLLGASVSSFLGSVAGPLHAASTSLLRTDPLSTLKVASFATSSSTSTSALAMASPLALMDCTSQGIQYFTTLRIPAALITGSSLAAFFTLVDKARLGKAGARSRIEGICLLAYHIFALVALLLSLNVIVISTASSNYLLLGAERLNPMAVSAYAFLKREVPFEFVMTRWSFYTGLFSFLGCIAMRALIEFDLLRKERIRPALLVTFSMLSLFFHLFAFVNQRLVCWPHMVSMTGYVVKVFVGRALSAQKNPAEVASAWAFVASVVTGVSLCWQSFSFNPLETAKSATTSSDDDNTTDLVGGGIVGYTTAMNITSSVVPAVPDAVEPLD